MIRRRLFLSLTESPGWLKRSWESALSLHSESGMGGHCGNQSLPEMEVVGRKFAECPWHPHLWVSGCCCYFSRVQLYATPQMAAHQAPLSLGFSRQEYWRGLPFPSPMHACMLSCFSHVRLCETLWTADHQALLSTGFSRQEYWSGLPFPSPSGWLEGVEMAEWWIELWYRCNKCLGSTLWNGSSELAHLEDKGTGSSHFLFSYLLDTGYASGGDVVLGHLWTVSRPNGWGNKWLSLEEGCVGILQHPLWNLIQHPHFRSENCPERKIMYPVRTELGHLSKDS